MYIFKAAGTDITHLNPHRATLLGHSMDIPVVNGDFDKLSAKLRDFIKKNVELCKPKALWICDGSEEEDKKLRDLLVDEGLLMRLPKYKNW